MALPLFGLSGGQQWGPQTMQQPGQTNQTSFQPNMYTNPQMGAVGGGSPANYAGAPAQGSYQSPLVTGQTPQGYVNPNSPMTQWQMGQAPVEAMNIGPTAGHMGQMYSYNPLTQQGDWVNAAGGFQIGGTNPYGQGTVSWIDPITGMQAVDPNALKGLLAGFGFGSGGGASSDAAYVPYNVTPFSGASVSTPDPYGGGDWGRPEALSAAEVIESYRPTMENEIAQGFAEAGNRLGQSGFGMSTAYATALGDVERLARAQMNQRALEYGYDATKFDREQEMQRQMAQNAEKFGAWQTHGGWGMQAGLANAGNALQQWALQNQLGMQGNQIQNQFQLQQQQMDFQNQLAQQNQQNALLSSLLGGLF